jgi:hypothetical protein
MFHITKRPDFKVVRLFKFKNGSTMVRLITQYSLLLLFTAALFNSCYYDNEEYLYSSVPCDNTFTFTSRIAPLVAQQCASGCHEGANPSAGLSLTTYDEIKAIVDNGGFAGSLDGTNGYSIMPKGTTGLSTCDKNAVNDWIVAGALNN